MAQNTGDGAGIKSVTDRAGSQERMCDPRGSGMFDGAALNCTARRGDSIFDAYRKKVATTNKNMASAACDGLDEQACGVATGCTYYAEKDMCWKAKRKTTKLVTLP